MDSLTDRVINIFGMAMKIQQNLFYSLVINYINVMWQLNHKL